MEAQTENYQLEAERWVAPTGNGLHLELACGQRKQPGYVGVDVSRACNPDIVCDLEQYPWPWEDNEVSDIITIHYVEHTRDLIMFVNECYRILEPDGKLRIVHPYLKSDRAFQDPTHVRFIPDSTWWYFNKEWRDEQKLDHCYDMPANFEVENIGAAIMEPWIHKSIESQQFALRHYWNVAADLTVDLRAIK